MLTSPSEKSKFRGQAAYGLGRRLLENINCMDNDDERDEQMTGDQAVRRIAASTEKQEGVFTLSISRCCV